MEARKNGDTETAVSTLDDTVAVLRASSQADSPEVQALISDTDKVRDEVAAEAVSLDYD